MKKAILPILLLFSLLLSSSAYGYTYYTVAKDAGDASHTTVAPSFYTPDNCTVTFTEYATIGANSFPFTATYDWFSPDNTNILTFPASYNQNITCSNIGQASTSSRRTGSLSYETKTTMTTSAATHGTWVVARYDCTNPVSNRIILISNYSMKDYYGVFPFHSVMGYGCAAFGGCSLPSESDMLNGVVDSVNKLYYGMTGSTKTCAVPTAGTTPLSPSSEGVPSYSIGTAGIVKLAAWYVIPFHNYYSLQMNYSIISMEAWRSDTGGGCGSHAYSYYLFDPVANTTTVLASGTGTLTVLRNRDYMIFAKHYCDASSGTFGFAVSANYTKYNLSINGYVPNLNCTAWSNCTNNQQTRYCTDLNGIMSPFIDQQACFGFAANTIFMGFDSGTSSNSFYCAEGYYNSLTGLCSRTPMLKTRFLPNGWYRNGEYRTDNISAGGTGYTGWVQDFVDVSQTDYYAPDASPNEGALKIWYIPRKQFLPIYNTTTGRVVCDATTEGQVGGVWSYLNNTFWVSHNVTALSQYMSISYRSKKCAETEAQTKAWAGCTIATIIPPFLGCNIYGNCQNSGLCSNATAPAGFPTSFYGDDYYTGSGCPDIPPASYLAVRIRDLSANITDPQNYQKQVTANNWELGYQEDNINNMNIGHVYEISYSAYPQNSITQTEANCILIDDVNVNFREQAVQCTSGCYANPDYNGDGINDYTYIQASALSTSSCTVQVIPLDYRCVPAALTNAIINLKNGQINYTCDGTTMLTWNAATSTATYTTNSSYCQALAGTTNPLNPMTGDVIISGFATMFTIPAVIGLIMALLISALITGKTSKYTEGIGGGHGGGVVFLMSFIAILTALTISNFFPLWLYIVLIVIAGGITAKVLGFI